ncbi:MAG: TetR/AcrR family transcriptional regulator [Polyangiales bacterium]
MGRKNLKDERTDQILAAFGRCVAEHGLAGATLERIAEYADLGRPAIRHNIGNREAVIEAAMLRLATQHKARYAAIVEALPDHDRTDALLRYLFTGPFSGPLDEEDAVIDELFAVRHREPKVAALLDDAYRDLQRIITAELMRDHPKAGQGQCTGVAYLIMALAFGHSTYAGLGIGKRRGQLALRQARAMVGALL